MKKLMYIIGFIVVIISIYFAIDTKDTITHQPSIDKITEQEILPSAAISTVVEIPKPKVEIEKLSKEVCTAKYLSTQSSKIHTYRKKSFELLYQDFKDSGGDILAFEKAVLKNFDYGMLLGKIRRLRPSSIDNVIELGAKFDALNQRMMEHSKHMQPIMGAIGLIKQGKLDRVIEQVQSGVINNDVYVYYFNRKIDLLTTLVSNAETNKPEFISPLIEAGLKPSSAMILSLIENSQSADTLELISDRVDLDHTFISDTYQHNYLSYAVKNLNVSAVTILIEKGLSLDSDPLLGNAMDILIRAIYNSIRTKKQNEFIKIFQLLADKQLVPKWKTNSMGYINFVKKNYPQISDQYAYIAEQALFESYGDSVSEAEIDLPQLKKLSELSKNAKESFQQVEKNREACNQAGLFTSTVTQGNAFYQAIDQQVAEYQKQNMSSKAIIQAMASQGRKTVDIVQQKLTKKPEIKQENALAESVVNQMLANEWQNIINQIDSGELDANQLVNSRRTLRLLMLNPNGLEIAQSLLSYADNVNSYLIFMLLAPEDIEWLKLFLPYFENINVENSNYKNAFYVATLRGQLPVMQTLHNAGVNINQDPHGYDALDAIFLPYGPKNKEQLLKYLAEIGFPIDNSHIGFMKSLKKSNEKQYLKFVEIYPALKIESRTKE